MAVSIAGLPVRSGAGPTLNGWCRLFQGPAARAAPWARTSATRLERHVDSAACSPNPARAPLARPRACRRRGGVLDEQPRVRPLRLTPVGRLFKEPRVLGRGCRSARTRSPSGGGEPKQARPLFRHHSEEDGPDFFYIVLVTASKKQAEARIRANVVWSMTRRSRSRPPRSALSAVIAGSVSKRRHSTATEQTEITDGARSCPGRTSRPHGLKPEGRAVRGAHSPRKSGDDSSARPVRRPESDLALCLAETQPDWFLRFSRTHLRPGPHGHEPLCVAPLAARLSNVNLAIGTLVTKVSYCAYEESRTTPGLTSSPLVPGSTGGA